MPKTDPFDIMGSADFGNDINCFSKFKLGWLSADQVTIMTLEDQGGQTFNLEAVNKLDATIRCLIIEIPKSKLAQNARKVDRIFIVYRAPTDTQDSSLSYLADGGEQLEKFSDLTTVDIQGVLVRAGNTNMESWDTHLFDAHPDTEFKDTTIVAEDGSGKDISVKDTGKFVDSFLNSGESMNLEDPMNLSISIGSFSDESFSITVTRSGDVQLPSLVKKIAMPRGMDNPREKQNVLFLMVRS